MDTTLLKIIIEAGSTGIALVLIFIIYKIVSNHLFHNIKTLQKLNDSIDKLDESVKTNTEFTRQGLELTKEVIKILKKQ